MKKIIYILLILILAAEVFGDKHPIIRLAPNEEFTPGYLLSETKEKLPQEQDYIMAVKTTGKNFTEVIYSYNGIRYPLFDKTEPLGNKLVSTFINNKYGIITEHGKILVSAKSPYKIIKIFKDKYLVTDNEKFGIMNSDYNLIIPIEFDSVNYINDKFIIVNYTVNSKPFVNIVDITGKKYFEDNEFKEIMPMENTDNFIGTKNNFKSVFSINGKQLTENYSDIELFNKLLICKTSNSWKIINFEGKNIFDGKGLGKITDKNEYGLEINKNGLYGFIDYTGEIILKTEYKEIMVFFNNIIGINDNISQIYNLKTKKSQTINHKFNILNLNDRNIIIKNK